MKLHFMRLAMTVLILVPAVIHSQQTAPAPQGEQRYTVFVRSRAIGQETVSVAQQSDGWLIRGSNQLGPPMDVVTRNVEIHYDSQWQPTRLLLEGTTRGQDISIKTTFSGGQAASEITVAGTASSKTDTVAADTVVVPNAFLGSYSALARRLTGQSPGKTFRAYIAPQIELPMRIDGVFTERIETPKETITATRFAVVVTNPPPGGDLHMSVWTDAQGGLLRLSVPAQTLEVAREDIASAASRTTSFSLPGDETVRIPAPGFGIGATVTKPAEAKTRLPALILIGGSGPTDRDGFVAGIPVLGQLARDLVNAGFLVVRYDKRGVGQSGGRAETSTLADYAEDVRAIVSWLEKSRKDVDKNRIGLVGHSEGAWVAMSVAARDKRVGALALIGAPSVTGNELVLEQQRYALERLKTPDGDKQTKIELQKKINAATLKSSGWEGIAPELRAAADNPWFQSFLAYDPSRVLRDVRQPILVVHGERDTQVPPHHGDRLAELARARKRPAAVDVVKVPGVNHLLVPAQSGEVDEYPTLPDKTIAPAATAAIAAWMTKMLGS